MAPMTYIFAAILILLPFLLEALVRNGFDARPPRRSPAFYILVPLTSLLVFGSFAALLGHPYISLGAWAFIYCGLAFVSNLKNSILGEPLVAPDLDATRHLFIYPEFYVDYVGAGRFIGVLATFAATIIFACIFETSFASHQSLLPAPAAWALGLVGWIVFLIALSRIAGLFVNENTVARLGISYDVHADIARFGLFPLMLIYTHLLATPHDKAHLYKARPKPAIPAKQPDIVVLQAESYFDITRLYDLMPKETGGWPELAVLKGKGVVGGPLAVPAWGACTMQSEFAFLTGIANSALGVDRINPYLRAANKPVPTIASHLKALGYRTVCVHPAKKEFFRRNQVIPGLGFDEFIGLEAFEDAERLGPYVSDSALGDQIEALIAAHHAVSDQPLFLFVITIESHGPWDQGRLSAWLDEDALVAGEPAEDHAFALYHHHMNNALRLFDRLGPAANPTRPRAMALYGDHQPALYDLFVRHGLTDKRVNYLLWHSETRPAKAHDLTVEDLADRLLNLSGLK